MKVLRTITDIMNYYRSFSDRLDMKYKNGKFHIYNRLSDCYDTWELDGYWYYYGY